MIASLVDLRSFKRRFVRAKADPSDCEYDPADDDTFFMGLAYAEMAAHHHLIDCASCGSTDVCRLPPFSRPTQFGTITNAAGHLYGYALCEACHGDREATTERVDVAFAGDARRK
jgi:hypothetical protein